MANESIDPHAAALADARAKRDALDEYIKSLEKTIASGVLGTANAQALIVNSGESMAITDPVVPVQLPEGAFRNTSVSNAIKLYLSATVKHKKPSEIADALKAGGVVSTSPNFAQIVYNTLLNLRTSGHVLKYSDGWGWAEHVPLAIRNRMAQQEKDAKKGGKKS